MEMRGRHTPASCRRRACAFRAEGRAALAAPAAGPPACQTAWPSTGMRRIFGYARAWERILSAGAGAGVACGRTGHPMRPCAGEGRAGPGPEAGRTGPGRDEHLSCPAGVGDGQVRHAGEGAGSGGLRDAATRGGRGGRQRARTGMDGAGRGKRRPSAGPAGRPGCDDKDRHRTRRRRRRHSCTQLR